MLQIRGNCKACPQTYLKYAEDYAEAGDDVDVVLSPVLPITEGDPNVSKCISNFLFR